MLFEMCNWLVTLWNFCPEDTKLIKVSCWRYIIYLFIVPFFVVQLIKQNLNITILIVIIMHILCVCYTNIYLQVYIGKNEKINRPFRTYFGRFGNRALRFSEHWTLRTRIFWVFGRFDLYSFLAAFQYNLSLSSMDKNTYGAPVASAVFC